MSASASTRRISTLSINTDTLDATPLSQPSLAKVPASPSLIANLDKFSMPPSHQRYVSRPSISPRNTNFAKSPPASPLPRRASQSGTARRSIVSRGKASSLSFPVLPNSSPAPILEFLQPRHYQQDSSNSKSKFPAIEIPAPTDSSFLTALAAQERQVLELRQELTKAEENLVKFKKQWVAHEATKRRNETSQSQQMTPLSTAFTKRSSQSEAIGVPAIDDVERKKAMLERPRTAQRRLFAGSRHTRTLSLLTPGKSVIPILPDPKQSDIVRPQTADAIRSEASRIMGPPDMISPILEDSAETESIYGDSANPQRKKLVRNSIQMAADLREGLWTFFEDLRQATYGDEARETTTTTTTQPTAPTTKRLSTAQGTKKNPPSSKRPSKQVRRQTWQIRPREEAAVDISSSFWKEHGLEEPKLVTSSDDTRERVETPQKTPMVIRDFDGETWDTWDSPGGKMSPALSSSCSSIVQTHDSPKTASDNTPRSSASINDVTPRPAVVVPIEKSDAIPWPALNRVKPNQIRSSAWGLMQEWENSINSPDFDKRVRGGELSL